LYGLVRTSKRLYPLEDVGRNYSGDWRRSPRLGGRQTGQRKGGWPRRAKGEEVKQANQPWRPRCSVREQDGVSLAPGTLDGYAGFGVAVMASVGGVS